MSHAVRKPCFSTSIPSPPCIATVTAAARRPVWLRLWPWLWLWLAVRYCTVPVYLRTWCPVRSPMPIAPQQVDKQLRRPNLLIQQMKSPHLSARHQKLGLKTKYELIQNEWIEYPSPLLTGYPMGSQTGYIQIQIHL